MASPQGMYSVPLYGLQELVASLASFQTWVGADNATEALERIHIISFEEDTEDSPATRQALRPFALVGFGRSASARRDSEGPSFFHSGFLTLEFENVAVGDTENAIFLAFLDDVGEIIQALEDATGRNGLLLIVNHEIIDGPGRPAESGRNAGALDIIGMALEMEWAEL